MFQNSRTTAEHSLMAGTIGYIALGSRTYHTEFWAFHSKHTAIVVLELLQREADLVCVWADACNRNGTFLHTVVSRLSNEINSMMMYVYTMHLMYPMAIACACVMMAYKSPHSEVGLELDFGLLPTSLFFRFLSSPSCVLSCLSPSFIKFGEMRKLCNY